MRFAAFAVDLLAELLAPWRCCACEAPVGRNRAFCVPCAVTITPVLVSRIEMPIISLGVYGGALETSVHALKFGDRPDLARPLGALLAGRALPFLSPDDALWPVPLGRSRLRTRGYNQAALLARAVARASGVRVRARGLARVRETAPQATLDREARRENVEAAFLARVATPGEDVWLVDDVATTGATLRAAGAAVEAAGGRVKGALVVAVAA